MHLSREAGWYDDHGNAVYIRRGEQFPDDDPAVKASPQIFDKLSDDVPPGGVKAAVKTAVATARGYGGDHQSARAAAIAGKPPVKADPPKPPGGKPSDD